MGTKFFFQKGFLWKSQFFPGFYKETYVAKQVGVLGKRVVSRVGVDQHCLCVHLGSISDLSYIKTMELRKQSSQES